MTGSSFTRLEDFLSLRIGKAIAARTLFALLSFTALIQRKAVPTPRLQGQQQKTGGCSGNGVIGIAVIYETYSAYAPPFPDKGFELEKDVSIAERR